MLARKACSVWSQTPYCPVQVVLPSETWQHLRRLLQKLEVDETANEIWNDAIETMTQEISVSVYSVGLTKSNRYINSGPGKGTRRLPRIWNFVTATVKPLNTVPLYTVFLDIPCIFLSPKILTNFKLYFCVEIFDVQVSSSGDMRSKCHISSYPTISCTPNEHGHLTRITSTAGILHWWLIRF